MNSQLFETPHIIINISDWIGHENEDYFIITLKFLSDQSHKDKLYYFLYKLDELGLNKYELSLKNSILAKENHQYESSWERYTYPKPEAKFATKSELLELFEKIKLDGGEVSKNDEKQQKSASGIPLLVDFDENYAIANNKTEHTIIFGETGSKKTRCVIRPLITSIANAHESMIITDVKGELSTDPKIIGHLKSQNYDIVFINSKNFNGYGYNIFEHAFRLYCTGKTDKAMAAILTMLHFQCCVDFIRFQLMINFSQALSGSQRMLLRIF